MDQLSTTTPASDEVSIADVLRDAWRARILLICITLAFGLGGLAYGLLTDREYQASVTVAPADTETSTGPLGGLGALASQYGGLASLAGITLPGENKKNESVAVLQSDLLTQNYIRDNNLLPVLFANKWDPVAKKWTVTSAAKTPTVWKGNQYFKKKIRSITDDKKTGLVVLTIRWKDPAMAAKWANDLVRITNNYLRNKAITESQRNIAYLNEQAAKTNVVEAKRAIYVLLQDAINKEMVARGRDEYALKVVDPAFPPEKPSSMSPLALTAVGVVMGAFFGFLLVLGRRILST